MSHVRFVGRPLAQVKPRLSRTSQPADHSSHVGQGIPLDVGDTIFDKSKARTFKIRKYGHRDLPLPPILDPIAVEARQKWRKKKPFDSGRELTPFQKELQNNVYARALATPIRMCALTFVRLPTFFLLKFKAQSHPPDAMRQVSNRTGSSKSELSYVVRAEDVVEGDELATKSALHIGNHAGLTRYLKRKGLDAKIVPGRFAEWHASRCNLPIQNANVRKDFVWHDNLSERTLEDHREDVVKSLLADATEPRLIPSDSTNHHTYALRLGADESEDVRLRASVMFNLATLLSEQDLETLMEAHPHLKDNKWFTLGDDYASQRTQTALLRLQLFLETAQQKD